ncbi:Ig-like domain-containing protein, partial [Methylobacter sp.]|uniref:Ig-like domain-containing protein n=1 Tax=Methylobacter sp. TaxID=2051955 RepID=UPI002FDE3DE5
IDLSAGGATGGTTHYSSATVALAHTVTAVNHVPVFIKGANQSVNEDAGAQTVSGWATGLSTGPANESGQTLSFTASNDNNALFSVQPSIDNNGNLSYTPAANANGSATVTVFLKDNGGTANGGVDTSASQIFTITVNAVNDAPAFIKGVNQAVNEDAGAQTVNGWATGLSRGPANESGQTLSFTASNDNNALFSVQPSIDNNGNLSYTPAANANGSATVTVFLKDNGGTANGGVDTSASQIFTITVNAVNDAPAFIKGVNQAVNEDAGAQTVNGWATGLSRGPANESGQTLSFTASNDNNALFSVQPTIDSNGNLSYTPAEHASGSATVTVSIKDSGGTANGGVDTSSSQSFIITVNHVDHLPTGAVTISGTPTLGTTLIAVNSLTDIDGLGVVSYQWQADGVDIRGATDGNYTLTEADVGKIVTVVARYTDAKGAANSVTSVATAPVYSITINLSQITGNSSSTGGSGLGSLSSSSFGGTGGTSGSGINNIVVTSGLGTGGVGGMSGSSFDGSGGASASGFSAAAGASSFSFDGISGMSGSGFGSSSSSSQTMVMDMKLSTDSGGSGTSGGTLTMPSSAFAGLDTSGLITITATQSSGQSLPSFISVNPSTGAVTVKEGAVITNPVTVKVTIKDSQGKQVVVLVKVQPNNGRTQQNQEQEQQQPDNGERSQQPGGDRPQGQNQRTQVDQTDKQLAYVSKPGLSQQLQMVGRKGFEFQRSKLLDSLASLVSNDKDVA